MVFTTPPCQPFSKAGSTPGWKSEESKPFIYCVNRIKALDNMQGDNVTYVIENVPKFAHSLRSRTRWDPRSSWRHTSWATQ